MQKKIFIVAAVTLGLLVSFAGTSLALDSWVKVYENDSSGNAVGSWDKQDLIDAVQAGANVRVVTCDSQTLFETHSFTYVNYGDTTGEVTAVQILAKPIYDEVEDKWAVVNYRKSFKTNGDTVLIWDGMDGSQVVNDHCMEWYVDDNQ